MRRLLYAASAAIIAAGLAACDSQVPVEPVAAKKPAAAPPANPAKAADEFRSTVTPKPAPAADAELGEKVKRALTGTPGVEIGAIEVAAAGGVVTLYGTVEQPAEKDRAAILALSIDGVRSVVNNLVVIRGS
jgi:osmotically-inducible protein OsmY